MNFILSILYAPLVFTAFRHYDIETSSLIVFSISLLWMLASLKKEKKQALYPLLYMVVSVMAYLLKDFTMLKVVPLLISSFITLFITLSYLRHNSVILHFAKRFARHEISLREEEYIHHSTLFWIGVSLINILIHLRIFLSEDLHFWIYYSSFGWYMLFAIAGILQFVHRKYFFKAQLQDV